MEGACSVTTQKPKSPTGATRHEMEACNERPRAMVAREWGQQSSTRRNTINVPQATAANVIVPASAGRQGDNNVLVIGRQARRWCVGLARCGGGNMVEVNCSVEAWWVEPSMSQGTVGWR